MFSKNEKRNKQGYGKIRESNPCFRHPEVRKHEMVGVFGLIRAADMGVYL